MIRAVAIGLSLIAQAGLSSVAAAETWRIGTEADYAPFVFHDDSGALIGFDKDLGDAICEDAGVTCIWTETGFDTLLIGLAAGQFDLVLAGIGKTPGRSALADFSIPYRQSGTNVGTFAGLTPGIAIDAALIAVQSGTTHEDWLMQTGRRSQGYPTNEDAIRAVLDRRADLVFGSSSYIRNAFETAFPQIRIVGNEEFPTAGPSVALRHGQAATLDRINAILQAMRQDGRLDSLESRWFVTGDPA